MTAAAIQPALRNRRRALVAAAALLALAAAATLLSLRPRPAQVSAGGSKFLRVTDDTGRTITVPQRAQRIVSLAPNITETLFAVGLGDRVVGVTDFCDYPPEAATRQHIGGTDSPNLERIAQLHPDLVVATRSGGNRLATIQSLENLSIPVFTTDPHSVDDIIASTQRIAEIAGVPEQGRVEAEALRRHLSDVAEKLAGSKTTSVLIVVWPDPLVTVGRNTFIADAVRRAGAENVIQTAQDWPNASLEEVARLQPQYLIFASDHSEESNRQISELSKRAGWRNLNAVRNGRILVLSESIARPAPRLVDQIELLARTLHPERFPADPAAATKGTR